MFVSKTNNTEVHSSLALYHRKNVGDDDMAEFNTLLENEPYQSNMRTHASVPILRITIFRMNELLYTCMWTGTPKIKVLRSSGISRTSGALIVRYSQRKKGMHFYCFLLF